MKLYIHPLSTYSHKAMIACHEAGVDVELETVNLMDEAAKQEYRKIYPIGKVPCLVKDDGHIIPESTIIIEYLNQEHGANLIPSDPTEARQTRFRDRMLDNYLTNAIGLLFFQNMRPEEQRDKERVDEANFHASTMYSYLEGDLANKTWLMGDDFSLADCAAFPPLFYAPKLAPFAGNANIEAYWQRLVARPSVAKVMELAIPAIEAFQRAQAEAA